MKLFLIELIESLTHWTLQCGSATAVDQPNVDDAQTDSKTEETVHTTAAEPADSKSHHIK